MMDTPITPAEIQDQPSRIATQFHHASGHLITFRPLEADDARILGAYFLSLSTETKRRYGPHPFDQPTAERLCANIDYTETIRMLATIGTGAQEKVIAYFIFILGTTDSDQKHLQQVGISLDPATDCTVAPSVADAFQNQGVGSPLMRHLIRVAQRLGRKHMVLLYGVQATNYRAIHFYQKLGFRKVGTFEHPAGQFNHDMIVDL